MCLSLFNSSLMVRAETVLEPSLIVTTSNDTLIIKNETTGETALIIYTNNHSSAIITDFDGSRHYAYTDYNGNICLDGKIVIKKLKDTSAENSKSKIFLQASDGYEYVTTYYTSTDVQAGAGAIGLALIGLVPGMAIPAALISVLAGYKAMVTDNVYMKVKQYYNENTHYIKNVVYMYKYSDYTGYLGSYTETHKLFN